MQTAPAAKSRAEFSEEFSDEFSDLGTRDSSGEGRSGGAEAEEDQGENLAAGDHHHNERDPGDDHNHDNDHNPDNSQNYDNDHNHDNEHDYNRKGTTTIFEERRTTVRLTN